MKRVKIVVLFLFLFLLLKYSSAQAQVTAGVYLTVDKTIICEGQQVTFTALPSGFDCDLFTVGWVPVLQSNNTSSPFSRTPTSTGTRQYYITIFDGTTTFTSNTVTVTVNPYPALGTVSTPSQTKQTTDGPVDLNSGFVTGAGGTIDFYSGGP